MYLSCVAFILRLLCSVKYIEFNLTKFTMLVVSILRLEAEYSFAYNSPMSSKISTALKESYIYVCR